MVLLVLICLVWIILGARFSANYPGIVQVRKFYNERVTESLTLPDELPYVIQVREIVDDGYEYEIWGRIAALDYANYQMTLVDKKGVEWVVRMIHPPYHNANKIEVVIQETVMERESGRVYGQPTTLTIDRREPEKTRAYLQVDDMINVIWRDTRTLAGIYRENAIGEYRMVATGERPRPIRKVVGR